MEYWKNLQKEDLEGEIWKDIIGWEGLYKISNLGRIKSLKWREGSNKNPKEYPIILKQRLCNKGYCMSQFRDNNRNKSVKVHRLVGIHFIENINNLPQINHINGVKTLNTVKNLEWITNLDNMRHSYSIGLRNESSKGEMNGRAILNEKDVIYIYTNPDRKTIPEIIKDFNLSNSTVNNIYNGKNWAYLTKNLKCNKIKANDIFLKCINLKKNNIFHSIGITPTSKLLNINVNIIYRSIKQNKEICGWRFYKSTYDEYINNKITLDKENNV